MFKDYKRYLSTSVKVYLFVLVIIFILKLIGLDYFGLDLDNKVVLYLSKLVSSNKLLNNLIFFTLLWINQYFMLSIAINENSKRMLYYNLALLPFTYLLQGLKMTHPGNYFVIIENIYLLLTVLIYKKIDKATLKRFFIVIGLTMLFQLISMFTRASYSMEYVSNPIINIILNLDYFILMLIVYKINFTKGDEKICGCQVEVGSSLLKKKSYSNLLENFLKNYSNSSKQEKAAIIIYLLLSLFWNLFTIFVVVLVAILNNTLIECIFIMTSFWISKKTFGKPYHLKSMIGCFVLSNITYYVLNRITSPIGISIAIPIMLGVGLSYVTSKLVKNIKPLYKGMSEEEFESTILKVVRKDSHKYKICYDFFVKKENAIILGYKYNYTESGIRKITSRVNDSIKALN